MSIVTISKKKNIFTTLHEPKFLTIKKKQSTWAKWTKTNFLFESSSKMDITPFKGEAAHCLLQKRILWTVNEVIVYCVQFTLYIGYRMYYIQRVWYILKEYFTYPLHFLMRAYDITQSFAISKNVRLIDKIP